MMMQTLRRSSPLAKQAPPQRIQASDIKNPTVERERERERYQKPKAKSQKKEKKCPPTPAAMVYYDIHIYHTELQSDSI